MTDPLVTVVDLSVLVEWADRFLATGETGDMPEPGVAAVSAVAIRAAGRLLSEDPGIALRSDTFKDEWLATVGNITMAIIERNALVHPDERIARSLDQVMFLIAKTLIGEDPARAVELLAMFRHVVS